MRAPLVSLVIVGVLLGLGKPAVAADQLLHGVSLSVKDPGLGPAARTVAALAREAQSPETIVGDPTLPGSAGGALLTLTLNGTHPTSQTFVLPQGTTSRGSPFWSPLAGGGFKYKDPKGEQGPVKLLTIKRAASALFAIKLLVTGAHGQVDLVPPDPGTDAYLTVTITGGDRYCVAFGADGKVGNAGPRGFKVRRPISEGCPP